MPKKYNNTNGKKPFFDKHFIFRKPIPVVQAFIEEAQKDARSATAHFVRVLEERYRDI